MEEVQIGVGNSGLLITFEPGNNVGRMVFTPEGNGDKVQGKDKQYALTFLGALGALLRWFKEYEYQLNG